MRRDLGGRGEQGYMLLAMVVAIFLVMMALAVAAPRMAKQLRREREEEAVHRGNQYVRAIQLYYRKMGNTYPGSIEQLEKANNIRFLRQRYVDPMTGKADWRLIKVGEAKTTVKGFFGEPLAGIAPGLGSVAGMVSQGMNAAGVAGGTGTTAAAGTSSAFGGTSAFGGSSSSGLGGGTSAYGSSGLGSTSGSAAGASGIGTPSGTGVGTGSGVGTGAATGTGTGNGLGMPTSSGMPNGGTPFVGVGLPVTGDSIIVLNEQVTYPTWEFLYDPRIEQLKKNASLFGGASSANAPGLGSAAGMSSGIGAAGTTGSSAFGSGAGTPGAFGSSPSGTGTTGLGTTGSGTAPTTTPAPQQ